MTFPTTPRDPLDKHVSDFIATLNPNAAPVRLPYTDTGDGYVAGQCHVNVSHRIRKHKGERVIGWMIWQNGQFVESECHSVWRDPSGQLIDITPRPDKEIEVLFVADPSLRARMNPDFSGCRVPCNRTNNPRLPFVFNSMPQREATVEVQFPAAHRAYVKRMMA